MTDLWRLSATALAARIRRREVSAAEADGVDRALARGDDPGPLAGVPVTVKVNLDQAGFATTDGVRLLRDLVAQVDNRSALGFAFRRR